MDAFFEALGAGRYVAGVVTGGPWDPEMQHGGPISALVARALSDAEVVPGQQLARVSFELLRPIPVAPITITTRVSRGGKRVSLADAVVTSDDGTELMLARAWRIQPTPIELERSDDAARMPPPDDAVASRAAFGGLEPPFMRATEVRFVHGHFAEPGPGAAWFRLRASLVAGTAWRPTDPLFVAADCGNGISGVLDFQRYVYINPDLTVHLSRLPVGEWVGLDAVTSVTPSGVSIATGRLHDETGALGRTAQTLYVDAR